MANEKEKDQKALIILPIFLVGGGLAYYFWKRRSTEDPFDPDPLPPTPPSPPDWTEWSHDITVRKIEIRPMEAFVGETVDIEVFIDYPIPPPPLPLQVEGSIYVNEELITETFLLEQKHSTVFLFRYVPKHAGHYFVRSQDKSASFNASHDYQSTYYSPYGGVRVPICTRIIIPDVNPFKTWSVEHPGGDLSLGGKAYFWIPDGTIRAIKDAGSYDRLEEAYPTEWSPDGSTVSGYSMMHTSTYVHGFRIIGVLPVDFTCRPYWDSKEELARMIAVRSDISWPISDEWRTEYGVTCVTCGGEGRVYHPWFYRSGITCRVCNGTGMVLLVDLVRGLKDWNVRINHRSTYFNMIYTTYLNCPYCMKELVTGHPSTSPGSDERAHSARYILNHIESEHPQFPLTSPRPV